MNSIDNKKIRDYLSGKLPADQHHEVEQWLLDHPFEADAMEGLQQSGSEQQVLSTVDQLNRQLKKQLQHRKHRRRKMPGTFNNWTYIAVVLILLLAVLVYVVIRNLSH